MNRYPAWKYILIFVILVVSVIYALPNLYGKDPALQISATRTAEISELTQFQIEDGLKKANIPDKSLELGANSIIVRFKDEDTQLRAQSVVQKTLGKGYVVAMNLAPSTPGWLRALDAEPMFLGLDLRGGVHFLMQVDMEAAVSKAEERYVSDIRTLLRDNDIRYRTISRRNEGGIVIRFRSAAQRDNGIALVAKEYPDLNVTTLESSSGEFQALAVLKDKAVKQTKDFALQQNITTLRKRVNELGVAEPVIQQQGQSRIVVQLPGVQDTARAKEILGATATLEFRMVDEEHNAQEAVRNHPPPGSRIYYDRNGDPVLLKKQIMLTGDYITDAAAGFDQLSGGPDVTITLDGKGARLFARETRDEVGKTMAVVYIENKMQTVQKNGKEVKKKSTIEEVINQAVIREQLGKRFHITGLDSSQEARNLALLLRAGALAAPVEIIEERTVGPSLGQDNINQGFLSVVLGFVFVLVFMGMYYKVFGMIANVALLLNLVLVVALLSMLQATLTLPGIAGIVLTVGMAVDANVLINERIREELRNGNSPQTSIHAGYEKAFSTIADANITTLIAALVLFSFGTGPIKGFAVTLSLGIISSMFTAIMVTRAIVNLAYGGRRLKSLSV
jgi:preprotein translocase subunit SecD